MSRFVVRPLVVQPARAWYNERADIDMKPSYQRRSGVWSTFDRAFLIDSIINGYDLPKFYFADFTMLDTPLNEHDTKYAVIDGKQRLAAIFGFLENAFPLDKDFVYAETSELRLGGLMYSDLQTQFPNIAARVDNYVLPIMSVVTDDESRINELFVRLNKGRSLSGPELRNAMGGVVPSLIRGLAEHEFFGRCTAFAQARMQDHNVAAKLLLLEFRGRPVETKKVNLDLLVREGKKADASVEVFESAAERVSLQLDRMMRVFVRRDPLLSTQGPVTVYYWLVRALDEQELPALRSFLVHFEEERRVNRRLVRDGQKPQDDQIQKYEALNRSTNDQSSIEERFQILLERYRDRNQGA